MGDIVIRRAREGDRAAVEALLETSWLTHWAPHVAPHSIEYAPDEAWNPGVHGFSSDK